MGGGLKHLRAMEAFEAVGRCGSVKGAATELEVSPGAISQQIRRLEEALGVTLMERRGRGLQLTQWGALYHGELALGFAQIAEAGRILKRAQNKDVLTICGLPTVTAKWLGQALWDWARERPDCPVRLLSSEIAPDLNKGEADLSMWLGLPNDGELGATLFTDQFVPACAPSLLSEDVCEPQHLLQLPLLHVAWSAQYAQYARFSPPSWTNWAATFGLKGVPNDPGPLSFALTSSAIDAAVAGQGVVLGQVAMMQADLDAGRLVIPFDLRVSLDVPYSLRWSRAALDKPGAMELRDWLLARGRVARGKRKET